MTAARAGASRRALLVAVLAISGALATLLRMRTGEDVPGRPLLREAAPALPSEAAAQTAGSVEDSASDRSDDRASGRVLAGDARSFDPPHARADSRGARCRIFGVVLDAQGAGVADLELWLVSADPGEEGRYLAPFEPPTRTARTDARGAFEILDVDPGSWLLGPSPRAPVSAAAPEIVPWAVRADVRRGEDDRRVELRVRVGLSIRGRVLQPDGTPAAGGWVSARMPESRGRCHAAADRDGSFRLGPLLPGQYELWADSDDQGTTSATVLAFAGEDRAELRLREGGILAGRVIDARPNKVGTVQLTAIREDADAHEMLDTSAGPDGGFRLRNVAPGTYQLVARTDDGWFAVDSGVSVESGKALEDLLLDLARGGSLRWSSSAGSASASNVEIRKDGVHVESAAVVEGGMILVPAGRITVRWTDDSRVVREREVEIVVGAETVFRAWN